MAEKKIQENPLPEDLKIDTDKPNTIPTKPTMAKPSVTVPPSNTALPARISMPAFTKASPNDLYRRLLPAVLFLLTFVTVMTILLIYMDTVALGAQQFRLNMSRDYELARIGQASAPLIAYVRQLHLAPRAPLNPPVVAERTPRVDVLDRLLGKKSRGMFVEFLPSGGRDATCQLLEWAGWGGVVVRARPHDYLALRTTQHALHACLSNTPHPREVTYQEADARDINFVSRVLCLPLYTVLLAGDGTEADYVLLGGDNVLPALSYVPFDKVSLKVIEFRSTDLATRNRTTEFLETKNYTIAATFEDGVMYSLSKAPVSIPIEN